MNKMNTINNARYQYDFDIFLLYSDVLHVVFPFIVNFALINSTRARLRYKEHISPRPIRQTSSTVHFIH